MIDLQPVRREWWYLAGLIATDGCLSRTERHVTIVAKEADFLEMIRQRCGISNRLSACLNGRGQRAYRIQICSQRYFKQLEDIGLTPAKSKSIGALVVPDLMWFDFLRGVIDGDGSIRRWTHPGNKIEQWSLRIFSAAPAFLAWIQSFSLRLSGAKGRIHHAHDSVWVLKYGKIAAQRMLRACYDGEVPALERKRRLALECAAVSNGWSRSRTVGQVAKLANAADS